MVRIPVSEQGVGLLSHDGRRQPEGAGEDSIAPFLDQVLRPVNVFFSLRFAARREDLAGDRATHVLGAYALQGRSDDHFVGSLVFVDAGDPRLA